MENVALCVMPVVSWAKLNAVSQTELETLALVWACERFGLCVYGLVVYLLLSGG